MINSDAAPRSIPRITVVATGWDHPDSVRLRAAQREEIAERYGTTDSEPGPAPSGADITVFYVAYINTNFESTLAVGCGGLRTIDASSGEIKRMYVSPQARGTGVSVALLRTLEQAARERGWSTLLLETGDGQPDALRFYQREGYQPVPNFGHYVGVSSSLCFGLTL